MSFTSCDRNDTGVGSNHLEAEKRWWAGHRARGTCSQLPQGKALRAGRNVCVHERAQAPLCVCRRLVCEAPRACVLGDVAPRAAVGASGPALPVCTWALLLVCSCVCQYTRVWPRAWRCVSVCTRVCAYARLSLHPRVSRVKPLGLCSWYWVRGNR